MKSGASAISVAASRMRPNSEALISPLRMRSRRHARDFRQEAHGQLLGRHFQGEEGHDAAVDGLARAVRLRLPGIVARDVEGDVGGQRRSCPSTGRRGEDEQVGGVQPAQLACRDR